MHCIVCVWVAPPGFVFSGTTEEDVSLSDGETAPDCVSALLHTERWRRPLLSGEQVEHLPEGQTHLLGAGGRRHGDALWWAPWVQWPRDYAVAPFAVFSWSGSLRVTCWGWGRRWCSDFLSIKHAVRDVSHVSSSDVYVGGASLVLCQITSYTPWDAIYDYYRLFFHISGPTCRLFSLFWML